MLSPEQFAELIVLIETSHEDDGPKPEVRRAQRISHPCRISINLGTSENAGLARKVQMKDISARGMCFLHDEDLPHGTDFVVKLEGPGGKSVSILSHVVHCRQLDARTFQIGSEFTCTLGHKEEDQYTPQQSAEDLMRIRSSILR
jgi:hypothetical protein